MQQLLEYGACVGGADPGTRATDGDFALASRDVIIPIVRAYRPDLMLVSAGFDAHRDEPLVGMQLTAPGFARFAAALFAVADEHASGCTVPLLEGGYDLAALAESVHACERNLTGEGAPAAEPATPAGERTVARHRDFHRAYWNL